jgi:hypothetical protein
MKKKGKKMISNKQTNFTTQGTRKKKSRKRTLLEYIKTKKVEK